MHDVQIGASQVPLFLEGTFQSHSSVARLPHLQRLVGPQMMARPPLGSVIVSQVMPVPAAVAAAPGAARDG